MQTVDTAISTLLPCNEEYKLSLISESTRFLVEPEAARKLIAEMETTVKQSWRNVARAAGVSDRDCERIAGAFAYPGFSLQLATPP